MEKDLEDVNLFGIEGIENIIYFLKVFSKKKEFVVPASLMGSVFCRNCGFVKNEIEVKSGDKKITDVEYCPFCGSRLSTFEEVVDSLRLP